MNSGMRKAFPCLGLDGSLARTLRSRRRVITEGRRALLRAGKGLEDLGQSAPYVQRVPIDELERGADPAASGIELVGLDDVYRIDGDGAAATDELQVYESLHGGRVYLRG